ncbi:MSHA biogenesis protein MshF [Shewanella algae]|uniref:MSHA biogenesis protein MshF n=1 Tax=Shewanella algae TaxID=38313 RepID=UPI001AAF41F1|nr:MSHA biogenesis protein MshF [Shewanella algae]MBO2638783.1 MSHA biogenesis protein MshF [Shewanella algae]
MPSQHQAEEDLLRTSARLAALLLLLVILAVLGVRYFSAVDQVSARGLQLEHHRLLNVLAMVRSQWLSLGRPEQMQLDWQTLERPEPPGQLAMNKAGWPQAPSRDDSGCVALWQQLLGGMPDKAVIRVQFLGQDQSCRYMSSAGESLSYQMDTGRVIFLTADTDY